MFALIFSGEAIFSLPFVVARVFRPTLLDTFGITNLELGTAFSLYGIVAMLSYVPGGALADRFPARSMMMASLLSTALGGILFAQIPSMFWLKALFAFWGLTTILLFWAAIIRATRQWGGSEGQGSAFGILDGGRGLFAALLASALVALFGSLLPGPIESATLGDKRAALSVVIWIITGLTAMAAALVYLCVPNEGGGDNEPQSSNKIDKSQLSEVLKNPLVWLQGIIIITAYTGYKGMDDLSLLARDSFGMNDLEAAQVTTVAFWTRPFAALGAGFIGDRLGGVKTIMTCFILMAIGDLVIAVGLLDPQLPWILFMNVVITGAAVFGLRGLYFAIFDDAGVSPELTGTAVGLVSVIGYTPDIFIGPINGYLTDTYKGALGHQYFFGVLAVFAIIGFVSALFFQRLSSAK
jgi:nitrate/nitrite transporter NarK